MLTNLQNQQFPLQECMSTNIWTNAHIEKTVTALLVIMESWEKSIDFHQ